jgi:hypothetical protein
MLSYPAPLTVETVRKKQARYHCNSFQELSQLINVGGKERAGLLS